MIFAFICIQTLIIHVQMKTKDFFRMMFTTLLVVTGLTACGGTDEPEILDGIWPPMEWSAEVEKNITVPAEGGTYLFTCTNYDSFWIAELEEDGQHTERDYDDFQHIQGAWLGAGVEENVMTVTIAPNTGESQRTARLTVTSGDIFDYFTFNQE